MPSHTPRPRRDWTVPMTRSLRGLAALACSAVLLLTAAAPSSAQALASEREKVSYAVGTDVGASLKQVAADFDVAAFETGLRGAFAGAKPALPDAEARSVNDALRARVMARSGAPAPGQPPGTTPPEPPPVDRTKAGQLLAGYVVGPSLVPIKDELEMAVFMRGFRDGVGATATPALDAAQVKATLEAFSARLRAQAQARAEKLAADNLAAGNAFLAQNKANKGVITTASGLQYSVLQQGAGARPKPGDRVRVHYHGTLLDGTVFDSSVQRGEPAEFALDQVIAGWTEGVALMPLGAKYRFWVPAALAYGTKGAGPQIGPNAVLVFDVELQSIL